MSLGFSNANRRPRSTDLPGGVGSNIIPRRQLTSKMRTILETKPKPSTSKAATMSKAATSKAATSKAAANKLATPASPFTKTETATTPTTPTPATPPPAEVTNDYWVYGTTKSVLRDCTTDEEVAPEGARVMLLYPMHQDEDEVVTMQLRRANPVTGQLTQHWVVVYQPDAHCVGDFSSVA